MTLWVLSGQFCDYVLYSGGDEDNSDNSNSSNNNSNQTGDQNNSGWNGGGYGGNNPSPNINNTGGVFGNGGNDGSGIITTPLAPLKSPQQIAQIFQASLTPNQLAWWNNPVNESSVASIIEYLTQNQTFDVESDNPFDFMNWAINYLMTNSSVTFEQFQNQFMGTTEGQDGEYDAAYWSNPNLTFPPQNLPSYNNFVASFPRNLGGSLMSGADNVYSYVGGDVWQTRLDYPSKTENTCALKVSRALNYSGVSIPNLPGQTIKGADNKFYFLNSKKLNKWMRLTFGIPSGANHINAVQAGLHGVNLPSLLNGKKGIYSLVSSNSTWAYGHVDFLKSDATCGVNCHFYDAPIDYIDIWILN